MEFHTFGDSGHQAIILIHGVLTPWQIWEEAIAYFEKAYYVVVPALDGHTENAQSEFRSVEAEAIQIEQYIEEHLNGAVYALCGLSMGGRIAAQIFMRNRIQIRHLILDGAPLDKMPSVLVQTMTWQYLSIIRRAKRRDPKVIRSFKKNFLPEKFLPPFLNFTDFLTVSSVRNMISSVGQGLEIKAFPADTGILFFHGTKYNEVYSRRSAMKLRKAYPDMKTVSFQGYLHGELAIYHQNKWIEEVERFLSESAAEGSAEKGANIPKINAGGLQRCSSI